MAKKNTIETMEIRIRMLTFVKDFIKDSERSIEYAKSEVEKYNEREKNGEELDRWDRQARLDYNFDIMAREQLNEVLCDLIK